MSTLSKYITGLILVSMILSCQEESKPLFESIDPSYSGITFSNRITETERYNVLEYEYVYNGGGVGIGDFNADGLKDIFFTGNMVPNQLYLNIGDFKFQNITAEAGVASEDRWSSSVQVVDINNDGLDDIHVTAMTYEDGNLRRNQLFLNKGTNENGIPQFEDIAEQANIADSTNTTTAAFLDYDNDGDLDLFLAVNKMHKKINPNTHMQKDLDGTSQIRDRLYKNVSKGDKIAFEDVSIESGILYGGFSLGVNVTDINNDGYKDIYVTNDYLTNDLMYVNNGDGSFTDKAMDYFKHTSYSAMGNDIADLNNDGLADIVVLDMLPEDNYRRKTMLPNNNYVTYLNNERFDYQYQFIRNTLQLNRGKRPDNQDFLFSETAFMSGISSTDWSWAPLIADFDLDGDRDIIATNGFPKDVTDRDFIDYNSDKGSFVTQAELLLKIPSVKIKNYAFRNDTEKNGAIPSFTNVTSDWGITEPSFSNGGAYVDLDNDGDLDYIVNNINDSATVFKSFAIEQDLEHKNNWIKINFVGPKNNLSGQGAVVNLHYGDGLIQKSDNTPYRGYLSSVEKGLHFGLGQHKVIDKIVVQWHDRTQILTNIEANQNLQIKYTEAQPKIIQEEEEEEEEEEEDSLPLFTEISEDIDVKYMHQESDYTDYNVQKLLMHKLSQFGPAISVTDINGDGLDDFYISGSHFYMGRFFIQDAEGKFQIQNLIPGEDGNHKTEEEMGTLFFDADNDGDQDLYLASGGYEFDLENDCYLDRLYLNNNGKFELAENNIPKIQSSSSCVKGADYDKDGDIDLFVGGRVKPFEYPHPVSSYLLENDGNGNFKNVNNEKFKALNNIGMVCDALWTDYNSDGDIDLMLAGEWMPIQFFKNKNGTFNNPEIIPNSEGWWNSIVAADFDKDGDIDYIVGNNGDNTLMKTSQAAPISLYYADFDKNGSTDIFPSTYFKDQKGTLLEFPYFGLGDMQKEVIQLKGQYKRHFNFAQTKMDEILQKFQKENQVTSNKLFATTLQSSYIENNGTDGFTLKPLPREAQAAPIFAMKAEDFDQDGHLDVLAIGNDYGTEVSQGRQDALNGIILRGDSKGNFIPMSVQESGIVIPGDAKSIAKIEVSTIGQAFIVGQNRNDVKVISSGDKMKHLNLNPDDSKAIITLKNGETYVEEFYYGDSYLSQSSRKLKIPQDAVSIEIHTYKGTSRIEKTQ